MKKLFYLFSVVLLGSLLSINSLSATVTDPVTETEITAEDAERAKVLNDRLNEINEMDKSALTRAEKRELRKEVKSINEELQQLSGGVYLSIGAIIVVLLLLILLL
jgi:hypothetical protein